MTPTFVKLLFALYIVNLKKKNLSVCNFLEFALRIQTAFDERIPKRYNTWGLESYFILGVGGWCGSGGWVWLGLGC